MFIVCGCILLVNLLFAAVYEVHVFLLPRGGSDLVDPLPISAKAEHADISNLLLAQWYFAQWYFPQQY